MGEFLAKPGAMEEFAGQIDTRLRRLMEMKDFQSAMRVQSLFSLVLLWTTSNVAQRPTTDWEDTLCYRRNP